MFCAILEIGVLVNIFVCDVISVEIMIISSIVSDIKLAQKNWKFKAHFTVSTFCWFEDMPK